MIQSLPVLADMLPAALLVLDEQLNIVLKNASARTLFPETGKKLKNIRDIVFYMPSESVFPLDKCIKKHLKPGSPPMGKSLLYKSRNGGEQLLFFNIGRAHTANGLQYICLISDMSPELDCLSAVAAPVGEDMPFTGRIIGQHEKMQELHRLIGLAADSNATVLITGESGTGKELVADAIHFGSERSNKPFVKVNCSALSETLLESELFGHIKGSFTGAYKDKKGKFEEAHGGTIFLDEISEISPALQVKLLRVIQEKTVERVGDNKTIKVDMRIIAATNRNLRELAQQGKFREDLFYRLNVFPIQTIPLRAHKNDIPLLCNYFIGKFNKSTGKHVKSISKDAYRLLMDYCWPGNVRELENIIEHAFVVVSGSMIDIFDFPQELRIIAYRDGICRKESAPVYEPVTEADREVSVHKTKTGRLPVTAAQLRSVLEKNGWNQSDTAKELGISRVALWKKMKKLMIL